jgi:hypothetical protein
MPNEITPPNIPRNSTTPGISELTVVVIEQVEPIALGSPPGVAAHGTGGPSVTWVTSVSQIAAGRSRRHPSAREQRAKERQRRQR